MASKARGTSQRPALRYVHEEELELVASTVVIHGSNAARWFHQNHTDAMMGLWDLKTFWRSKGVEKINEILDWWQPEIRRENQLRLVVYPIIYMVLYISGGAGFLPSTVSMNLSTNIQGISKFRTSQWKIYGLFLLQKREPRVSENLGVDFLPGCFCRVLSHDSEQLSRCQGMLRPVGHLEKKKIAPMHATHQICDNETSVFFFGNLGFFGGDLRFHSWVQGSTDSYWLNVTMDV